MVIYYSSFLRKNYCIMYSPCAIITTVAIIAGLCNGSTTDSGSVCEGSNPSPAASWIHINSDIDVIGKYADKAYFFV